MKKLICLVLTGLISSGIITYSPKTVLAYEIVNTIDGAKIVECEDYINYESYEDYINQYIWKNFMSESYIAGPYYKTFTVNQDNGDVLELNIKNLGDEGFYYIFTIPNGILAGTEQSIFVYPDSMSGLTWGIPKSDLNIEFRLEPENEGGIINTSITLYCR